MQNQDKQINIIFMGTPDFAVPGLQALIDDDSFNIKAVITQTDKKIGRKQIVSEPAVKKLAKKHNLKILQPLKITNAYDEIVSLSPDLIVVTAYGQIIPEKILEIPKYGCVNIHASLLPKYRGAACIQAAILNQDQETGLTIMKMDAGLDTGPIIHQEFIAIKKSDTAGTMFDKLASLSQEILSPILRKYIDGQLEPIAQDNSLASYIGMINKKDGKINWNKPADEVYAQIRAMSPWPGAYSVIDTKKIKIIEVPKIAGINKYKPGTIFEQDSSLFVQCSQDSLEINKLQIAGKNIINSDDFIRGYSKFMDKQFE